MKILQVCLRVPYPPDNGGNVAMYNFARALKSQHNEIYILALNTQKHFINNADALPLINIGKFKSVPINTEVKASEAFFNLFSSESYNIKRFFSSEFEERLIEILHQNNFDIVILESLFVTPYIEAVRKFSKAKIILRAHNVEHMIWENLAVQEKNFLKKKYLQLLAYKLKKYELEKLIKTDAILAISPDDEEQFKLFAPGIPVHVVPVSLDESEYSAEVNFTGRLSLFHLASMNWLPNIEAVGWLLEKVWPRVKIPGDELILHLAGRDMPKKIFDIQDNRIKVAGEIKDSKRYILDKHVMLVPLLSGSGMRVKIIEGLAAGKVIISTSKGAEGIEFTTGENILIADSPEDFAAAITRCYSDRYFCGQLSNGARKLFLQHYSNRSIGEKVQKFLEQL